MVEQANAFPRGSLMCPQLNNSQTQQTEIQRYSNPPGPEWQAALDESPHAHLAMAPHWYEVIQRAYAHQPLYFSAQDGAAGRAVLPAFRVHHWLLGTVVTSMPFLDAGGPCGASPGTKHRLADRLLTEARALGAGRVELRCTAPLALPVQPSLEKVTLVLPLPSDPDRLWRSLDPKVRNQVRKAERSGLSIEIGGIDRLDEFYSVFAVNMRDLGSPLHAKTFFRVILEGFGQSARVILALKDTTPLGGLIALAFKDTVYVPWASSLRQYAPFCPNMLLYWEALRLGCKNGFSRFDFGRSSRRSGTYRFKRQWGAAESQLYWYTIPLGPGRAAQVSAEDGKWATMSQLWRRLPVGISRMLGPKIRKYLTQ
jgi:FemAB-related protein (PEP-CTERM system-associated)